MGNKLVRAGTGQTERFCAGKCTFLYPPLGSLAMVRSVHALCAELNEQRTSALTGRSGHALIAGPR